MNMESFEDIKVLMDNFDPVTLLPDLSTVVGQVEFVTRIAVLIGPIVLLIMGIAYFLFAPKEANYHFGYRCYYGMGSVEAWRFTQRLAGAIWTLAGIALTVVMTVITTGFPGKEIMDVINSGVTCLVWEVALAAVSCVVINVLVMLRYNRKGERRR